MGFGSFWAPRGSSGDVRFAGLNKGRTKMEHSMECEEGLWVREASELSASRKEGICQRDFDDLLESRSCGHTDQSTAMCLLDIPPTGVPRCCDPVFSHPQALAQRFRPDHHYVFLPPSTLVLFLTEPFGIVCSTAYMPTLGQVKCTIYKTSTKHLQNKRRKNPTKIPTLTVP